MIFENNSNSNNGLSENPASLLILNLNSFAGGSGDVWSNSRGKSGI
jgi:hypothetical protein